MVPKDKPVLEQRACIRGERKVTVIRGYGPHGEGWFPVVHIPDGLRVLIYPVSKHLELENP